MDSLVTEERLRQAVTDGHTVEIRGYTFSEKFQRRLELSLQLIFNAYDKSELFPVVNAVARELNLWASLANQRQLYFEEFELDLNNAEHVNLREAGFQASLTTGREADYRRRAKERGLFLHTRITHNPAGARIEVWNNARHSEPLEERLRQYLGRAMQYRDIMEYYRDYPEDADGRGVGLAFSLLMLKEESLRPELMRLGQSSGRTVSRLEIPFDNSYASIRDRIERGEDVRPFEGHDLIPAGLLEMDEAIHVQCPICGNEVDERVFFPEVSSGMINGVAVLAMRSTWKSEDGACASCLATYE